MFFILKISVCLNNNVETASKNIENHIPNVKNVKFCSKNRRRRPAGGQSNTGAQVYSFPSSQTSTWRRARGLMGHDTVSVAPHFNTQSLCVWRRRQEVTSANHTSGTNPNITVMMRKQNNEPSGSICCCFWDISRI